MITLGTQYYRAPFPDSFHWEDDFRRIADAGLNTVQLWVIWAWVESEPGRYAFDEYDQLMDLAGRHGLGVVLSTIAEVQPQWIHRIVPDSELVTRHGQKVLSSNRNECHFGFTPGGCTDHPEIWKRMSAFIAATVTRYRGHPQLRAWDIWNELRWQVNAEDLTCYCPHTLAAFRAWLGTRHGDLAGLNRAWRRRYVSWDDVIPGRMASEGVGPFTEMAAFQHFITERANAHGRERYEVAKALDPQHPVAVHGPCPSMALCGDMPSRSALWRGNDWALAETMDGIGMSAFPNYHNWKDDARFATYLDAIGSAAQGKGVWLSELQGGGASQGTTVCNPVLPHQQQRWLWMAVSRKADTILFWCWRDEVFGAESGGFGISGNDGNAQSRIEAFRRSSAVLKRHEDVFKAFEPDAPAAGVLFSPQSFYHYWVLERSGETAHNALLGYARAMQVRNIPFRFVEEGHLGALAGLKVLFLPRTQVMDEALEHALRSWVEQGGTLVAESECGAYTSSGFFRYPADRLWARLTGLHEGARQPLKKAHVDVSLEGRRFRLRARQWLTPLSRAPHTGAGALALSTPVGRGRVVLLGGYFGDAYWEQAYGPKPKPGAAADCEQFEGMVAHLACTSGVESAAKVTSRAGGLTLVRAGRSRKGQLVFVFSPPNREVTLRLSPDSFAGGALDLLSDRNVSFKSSPGGSTCRLLANPWGIHVLMSPDTR